MHNVVFKKDEKQRELTMTATGHAGRAGSTVCASCSILAYTLAQNVVYWHKAKMTNGSPQIKIDNKGAAVEIKVRMRNQSCFAQALNGFLVLSIGYILLEHNYPDKVHVDRIK